jgi:uncharacterized membrane protein YjgN (DUF898 family)
MDFDQTQPLRPEPQQLRFTGSGGEYFRIWIVNLLLTIVTLGIYSAWAKVRRLQYFYRSTELAGSSFEYHGNPLTILKGRIVAVLLFFIYNNGFKVSPLVGLVSFALVALVLPILLRNSLRFRLHNSSYRGLRFGFGGSAGGAYRVFLGGFFGSLFTLYFAAPFFHQRIKQYQHGNSRYGTTPFSFHATVGGFYGVYGIAFLIVLGSAFLGGLLMGVFGHGLMPQVTPGSKPDPHQMLVFMFAIMGFIYLPIVLLVAPYLGAHLQNLVWNNTRLGEHRFEYKLSALRLFWIYFSNLLGVVLTLGFFAPWAMVRLARYRAECMTFVPASPLEGFIADQEPEMGAIGEEAAGVFDIDISF